ncbi:MAG TPA: hypothetical protein VJQ44_15775 [Gemmatimonadales bacterium]|nr:hypothetical protein [Gemmatimonadales bacterium]
MFISISRVLTVVARPAALLTLVAIVAACDLDVPTGATAPVTPVVLAKSSQATGAFVFKGQVPGGLLMIDFDRERTLIVGNTAEQLATICATGIFPEEITELDVLRPTGALHVLLQARDLPAVVWPVLSVDPCGELQGVTPLAEGIASGIYADNDLLDTSPGAGSFGITANGRMTETATGRPLQLRAKFRNVFLPDGTIKLPVNHILLQGLD